MARKALATIGCGPMKRVLDQALPTFADFAERHSYDLVPCRTNEHAQGRPPSWGKVRMMRDLLERYDIVLWVDADAIILDGSADPADLLGPEDYQALVCLHQLGQEFPTCGVWLLRSTPKAKAFLDAVWTKEQYTDDRYWEQAAALELLGYSIRPANLIGATEWTEGTLLLDEAWNCMPLITRSRVPCRIRHYAGETNAVRHRQMRADRRLLDAERSTGWRRRGHRAAATLDLLRWRLWDGPTGTFGSASRLLYPVATKAYGAARSTGVVALVRAVRRSRRSMVGRTSDASGRAGPRGNDLLADIQSQAHQKLGAGLQEKIGPIDGHVPRRLSIGSASPRPGYRAVVGGPARGRPHGDVLEPAVGQETSQRLDAGQ